MVIQNSLRPKQFSFIFSNYFSLASLISCSIPRYHLHFPMYCATEVGKVIITENVNSDDSFPQVANQSSNKMVQCSWRILRTVPFPHLQHENHKPITQLGYRNRSYLQRNLLLGNRLSVFDPVVQTQFSVVLRLHRLVGVFEYYTGILCNEGVSRDLLFAMGGVIAFCHVGIVDFVCDISVTFLFVIYS